MMSETPFLIASKTVSRTSSSGVLVTDVTPSLTLLRVSAKSLAISLLLKNAPANMAARAMKNQLVA